VEITSLVSQTLVHIIGVVASLGIGAAFSTYKKSLTMERDLNHAFKKLRELEDRLNEY
jgi:hypothetical protein